MNPVRVFVFLSFLITSDVAVGHGLKGDKCCHSNKIFDTIQKMLAFRGHCAHKERDDHHLAAFSAVMSGPLTATRNGQRVVFSSILTNYGNAYKDGVFTCPIRGLYVFHWTIVTVNRRTGCGYLTANGKFVKYGGWAVGSNSAYGSASSSAVLQLEKGDKVSINTSKNNYIHPGHSSFQGWLLREL